MTDPTQPNPPEAVDSVEREHFSIENTGAASGDKLDTLIQIAADVKDALDRRVAVVILAVLVPLLAGAIMLYGILDQAHDIRKITAGTNRNSMDIQRVLDAMTTASNSQSAASVSEGRRRTVEVDCLVRRALARLPAPNPDIPCVDQTPKSVYPG